MTALLTAAIAVTAILALRPPRAPGPWASAALVVAVAAAHGYGADLLLGAVAAATVTAGTVALLYRQVAVILPAGSWAAHTGSAS